eukprot:scaffold12676_cov112-Isochrysis_galbana.AAC.14
MPGAMMSGRSYAGRRGTLPESQFPPAEAHLLFNAHHAAEAAKHGAGRGRSPDTGGWAQIGALVSSFTQVVAAAQARTARAARVADPADADAVARPQRAHRLAHARHDTHTLVPRHHWVR